MGDTGDGFDPFLYPQPDVDSDMKFCNIHKFKKVHPHVLKCLINGLFYVYVVSCTKKKKLYIVSEFIYLFFSSSNSTNSKYI